MKFSRLPINIHKYIHMLPPHVPTFGVLRWCLKPFSWHSIGYALSPKYDMSCMPFIYPMEYPTVYRIQFSMEYPIEYHIYIYIYIYRYKELCMENHEEPKI